MELGKNIRGVRDLEEFGINFLTGEACPYALRLLCDVSAEGKDLIERFLGVKDINLYPNNNSATDKMPSASTGSIMLPRDIFWDLAAFALFVRGYRWVIVFYTGGNVTSVRGVTQDEYDAGWLDKVRERQRGAFDVRVLYNINDRRRYV